MKRLKFVLPVILAAAVLAALFPFSLLLNDKAAYFVYKEVTYRRLIDTIAGSERDPEKVSLKVLDYFYYQLFTPPGGKPMDKDVFNDLIRGISWCDQRSWGMGKFLAKRGIASRMVMTNNPEGESNHTVLEVFIGGRWRMFDPLYGLAIRGPDGGIASYEDICKDSRLFYESPEMLMLKQVEPGRYEKAKEFFTRNIYYDNPSKPVIWDNTAGGEGALRKMIVGIIDIYAGIFGDAFTGLYQDAYLAFRVQGEDEGSRLYFKARNYDIYGRDKQALDAYKKFITEYPEYRSDEDALFFLGVLYFREGRYRDSVAIFESLIQQDRSSKWNPTARYFIGYDLELSGKYEEAKAYYRQAIKMYNLADPGYGLNSGEFKSVERLYNILDK